MQGARVWISEAIEDLRDHQTDAIAAMLSCALRCSPVRVPQALQALNNACESQHCLNLCEITTSN